MLGIVCATEHFRHYLLHAPFTLRTDHGALTWLHTFKSPTSQVSRWLERMAEFTYTIQHCAGKSHGNADALSRYPHADISTSTDTTTHRPMTSTMPVSHITALVFT
eukprot:scpid111163/ scgid10410/ Retrovirus-related Pol polyprotein from transposon 297; Protease; Reverse transcriptase; Endonuclease